MPAAVPLGPQFTVSAVSGTEAGPPVVAIIDPSGAFVAAWESLETDGSGIGVYAQAFQADGTPVGTPLLVNETTDGNQSRPAIATDGAGNVLIAWQSESAGGGAYDIYSRFAALSSNPALSFSFTSSETPVNVVTTGSQTNPTVAMDVNGNFVIGWQSDQDFATTGLDIYGRYGTVSGGLAGSTDTPISTTIGDQRNPDVAMAATGTTGTVSFTVAGGLIIAAWTGPGPVSSEGEPTNVVLGTLFTYDAALTSIAPIDAAHTEYQLTAAAQHDQVNPDVAMAGTGQFVLVWQAEGQQGSGSDVFMRRFAATGDGLDATNVIVNTVTSEPQRNPAVGIDGTGNYFITWQSQGADARSWGIVARAFDANGNETRADFIVNVNEQGPQTNPAVAVAPNGQTVAVWSGPFVPSHGGTEGEEGVEGEGGHQPSLFARLFSSTGVTDVTPGATALNVNGLEFQLATVGAGEDVPASAARTTDGNYIVVWEAFEETEDVSGYGVYGQRVAPDGTLIGPRFLVNETTLGYQSHPSVAALPGGGFVVAWQSETRSANGYDIYARLYPLDGTGTPDPGAEFLVNENTRTGHQTHPSIASDAAGNFIIVWQSDAQDLTEDLTEIYARRYSSSGSTATPLANEFRVNTETATVQYSPQVAMNALGQFAVTWVSDHNVANDPTDTEKSIFVRWFDASGVAANSEFLASVYTKDAQEHPEIGIDMAGDIVVAWQSINQATGTGVSWDVFARQFHPDGSSPQTEEFQVNETVAAPQRFPGLGVDAAGRFAIAWQTINQDGSSWAIYQRQYRADGTPDTGEQIVNTVTSGPQILPVFARDPLGNYGVFWSGTMADHVDGIGGRSFIINTVPTGPLLTGPSGPLSGPERQPIAIPLSITSADTDVAVTLSVVITGVPSDATLSAGALQSDGSWVLTPAELVGLTLTAAHEETLNLVAIGIATEVKTGRQAFSALPITVNVLNVDFYAVGMGGGGALVRQYALDGSLTREINAFPGFTGGVHVATGDVNGDGVPDLIAGAGPGGGPNVKVFDGSTGGLIRSFFAYDPSFTGGVFVAAGDFTGDGKAEIVTGAGLGGGSHVKVFDGATGATLQSFLAYEPSARGGVSVAAGDVTGDGAVDIVTGAGPGGGPHVKAFDGKTGAVVQSFFAFEPTFTGGVLVAVGNVVGDGRMDIIAGPGVGGGARARIFDGHDLSSVTNILAFDDPSFRGGLRVGAVDRDGDGLSELIIGSGPGATPRVQILEPISLNVLDDFLAFDAANQFGVWVG